MALVREVFPGDIVEAYGWDIALNMRLKDPKSCSVNIGWLIPHGMNHKKAVEMGHKITLLYVGPVKVKVPVRDNPGYLTRARKFHHFLTDDGGSVCLEGHEFRHFKLCTTW